MNYPVFLTDSAIESIQIKLSFDRKVGDGSGGVVSLKYSNLKLFQQCSLCPWFYLL